MHACRRQLAKGPTRGDTVPTVYDQPQPAQPTRPASLSRPHANRVMLPDYRDDYIHDSLVWLFHVRLGTWAGQTMDVVLVPVLHLFYRFCPGPDRGRVESASPAVQWVRCDESDDLLTYYMASIFVPLSVFFLLLLSSSLFIASGWADIGQPDSTRGLTSATLAPKLSDLCRVS